MAKLELLRARKRIQLQESCKSINQIRFRLILRVFVPIEYPIKWCPRDECIVDYNREKNPRREAEQNDYPVVDTKKHQSPTHTNYKH